jgi:DNA-binding NarL/FixJ family response regulator
VKRNRYVRLPGEDLELTPREVEVLDRLAGGRSDRQIGDDRFISRKTASVHVSNILRRLAVAGRVEAGEIGQRAGLG